MSKRLNPNSIGFFFNKVSRNEPDIITALPPNSPTSTDENTTSSSPTNIMITLSTASSSSTNLNPSCSTNQKLRMAERAAISELPHSVNFISRRRISCGYPESNAPATVPIFKDKMESSGRILLAVYRKNG